jgi:hypothetical protein
MVFRPLTEGDYRFCREVSLPSHCFKMNITKQSTANLRASVYDVREQLHIQGIIMKQIFFILLIISAPSMAQVSAPSFIGGWELISIESKSESGEWSPYYFSGGAKPVGIIMYDAAGNMSAQITSNPRTADSPAEQPDILNGYVAYYAKYEVDSIAGTVTHHRRNHSNPVLSKLSVVRYFQFHNDILTLTVAPEQTLRLNWARIK